MTKLGVLDVRGNKYTLKLGEIYFVGIKSDEYSHDIDIEDASVDIKHCFLDLTERPPKLFDLRSKCGTFVDGKRIAINQMIPLLKSTAIQFGNVESTLQLVSEGDSGYLEGRITPAKDSSEIICNSPEHVPSSCFRLKQTLKNSLTSTPNATAITNNSIKKTPALLVPTGSSPLYLISNTSTTSVDSFCIPETQYPVENNNKTNNSANVSIGINESRTRNVNTAEDDDFFIPETQEVVSAPALYPRVSLQGADFNECVPKDKIPPSQFRICTQDFVGSDDNLSNNSDDILANVPCSMVIPIIRHEPVRVEDILGCANDEEEMEKEMSALQWSKRTADEAEACATPDHLFSVNALITRDVIKEVGVGSDEVCPTVSQCSTPDIFAIPDQLVSEEPGEVVTSDIVELKENVVEPVQERGSHIKESSNKPDSPGDMMQTQVFKKLSSESSSFTKPFSPPRDKENIGPQKDRWSLPATQVFIPPPPVKIEPSVSSLLAPRPPPKPVAPRVFAVSKYDEDDLPPTQVFQRVMPVPPATVSKSICLSSTLLDNGMQLSESSFRAKCNKFLDSDDDEMDEIVAPELVKKMRESIDKQKVVHEEKKSFTIESPPITTVAPTPKKSLSSQLISKNEHTPTLQEKRKSSPRDKFRTPAVAVQNVVHPKEDVVMDDLTPAFLCKKLSKDKALQKFTEVIAEKRSKSLFGSSSESDDSRDFLADLLPNKGMRSNQVESAQRQKEKPKTYQQQRATLEARVTRRRKSTFEEGSKGKKHTRKTAVETKRGSNKKIKSDSKEKHELVVVNGEKKIKATVPQILEPNETRYRKVEPDHGNAKLHANALKNNKEKYLNTDNNINIPQTSPNAEKLSSSRSSATGRITRQTSKDSHSNHLSSNKLSSPNRSIAGGSMSEIKSAVNSEKKERNQSKDTKKKTEKRSKSKKVTKSEEAVPLLRLTRLRSAKDVATKESSVIDVEDEKKATDLESRKTSEGTQMTDLKVNIEQKKQVTNSKSSYEETSSKVAADDQTSKTNDGKTVSSAKRKDASEVTKVKRLRSTSSTESAISTGSRRIKKPSKPKIAITMTDASYHEVLQRHSGTFWLYTQDPKVCDVMVVEIGNRTYKLMVAIARGIPVVKLDWLKEVLKRKTADIPFDSYIFEDCQFQARHKFEMKKSLHLAQTTSLLDGFSFMMTPNIRPVPDEMKDIIICAGGIVLEHIPTPQDGQEIYLVSHPRDNQHWHRFRRTNPNIKIVSTEGVMTSVMQQSINPLKRSIMQ